MRKYFLVLFLMSRIGSLCSQTPDSVSPFQDSSLYGLVKEIVKQQAEKKQKESVERRLVSRQSSLISKLRNIYQEVDEYVKKGIDTVYYKKEFEDITSRMKIAEDGIFENKGSIQTARNLSISSILYKELLKRVEGNIVALETKLEQLNTYRNTIDSLSLEPEMYAVPSDSIQLMNFFQRIILSAGEHAKLDSTIFLDNQKLVEYATAANLLRIVIKSQLSDIESYRSDLSKRTFKKELAPIWGNVGYTRSFKEILRFSYLKNKFVLLFYVRNHSVILLVTFMIALGLGFYLKTLKSQYDQNKHLASKDNSNFFLNHPFSTGFFVTLTIGQFVLPNPPFVLNAIYWIIGAFLLSIILKNYITKFWFRFWLVFIFLFTGACFGNFILQASRVERYILLAFSVAGCITGIYYIFSNKRNELKEGKLWIFLWVFVMMQLMATYENAMGGYNFGKALFTSGFIGLVVGIMLLWTVRIVVMIISLSAEKYVQSSSKSFIDFKKLSAETPGFMNVLAVAGWIVLVGKNFYIYNQITEPFIEFFTKPYKVGDFTFSLQNILLFIFIIVLSSAVSKFVSFFVSNPGAQKNSAGTTGGIGSWLLLLRIGIMSLGLLLAFAATGIPIDRLTIIFGGLSVGIGFGLQAIFESLISGIIIAFEKPINIGDQVQIGSQAGVMKSIGIRSSVVVAADGSHIIIPNSDLIKNHLVNWNASNGRKRVGFLIGVGYGSDVEKVIQLIGEILKSETRVLANPEPTVVINEYAASSIDINVLYWIELKTNNALLKSDILRQIRQSFEQNNIDIPFPQLVVHQVPNQQVDGNNFV